VCGVRLYVKGGGVVSCCASKVQIAFSKRNKGKWPNGEGSLGDRWKLVIGPIKMKMSDKKKSWAITMVNGKNIQLPWFLKLSKTGI